MSTTSTVTIEKFSKNPKGTPALKLKSKSDAQTDPLIKSLADLKSSTKASQVETSVITVKEDPKLVIKEVKDETPSEAILLDDKQNIEPSPIIIPIEKEEGAEKDSILSPTPIIDVAEIKKTKTKAKGKTKTPKKIRKTPISLIDTLKTNTEDLDVKNIESPEKVPESKTSLAIQDVYLDTSDEIGDQEVKVDSTNITVKGSNTSVKEPNPNTTIKEKTNRVNKEPNPNTNTTIKEKTNKVNKELNSNTELPKRTDISKEPILSEEIDSGDDVSPITVKPKIVPTLHTKKVVTGKAIVLSEDDHRTTHDKEEEEKTIFGTKEEIKPQKIKVSSIESKTVPLSNTKKAPVHSLVKKPVIEEELSDGDEVETVIVKKSKTIPIKETIIKKKPVVVQRQDKTNKKPALQVKELTNQELDLTEQLLEAVGPSLIVKKKKSKIDDSIEKETTTEIEEEAPVKRRKKIIRVKRKRSKLDDEPTEEEKQDEYRVLIKKIHRQYPALDIPNYPDECPSRRLEKIYNNLISEIEEDNEITSYKMGLNVMFVIIEVVGCYMGLPLQGYADMQAQSMSKYHRMLIEVGKKNYIGFAKTWPVEIRLVGLALVNALILALSVWIAKGDNLARIFTALGSKNAVGMSSQETVPATSGGGGGGGLMGMIGGLLGGLGGGGMGGTVVKSRAEQMEPKYKAKRRLAAASPP